MNDCVFSFFVSSASSSGIGSYAQAARMGTGLMGASSSAMGGMVAWMNGNQCGDISEVVVTPDKSWVVPVAETTNTILDNIGYSLKNHGGNSTWGSNGHFYWHGASEHGFYGNKYVRTTKLANIGRGITKFTGKANMFMNGVELGKGYIDDDYQIGYHSIKAATCVAGGWAGGRVGVFVGLKAGAEIGVWFGVGVIPSTIIGGAAGGIIGSLSGSALSEWMIDKFL